MFFAVLLALTHVINFSNSFMVKPTSAELFSQRLVDPDQHAFHNHSAEETELLLDWLCRNIFNHRQHHEHLINRTPLYVKYNR